MNSYTPLIAPNIQQMPRKADVQPLSRVTFLSRPPGSSSLKRLDHTDTHLDDDETFAQIFAARINAAILLDYVTRVMNVLSVSAIWHRHVSICPIFSSVLTVPLCADTCTTLQGTDAIITFCEDAEVDDLSSC